MLIPVRQGLFDRLGGTDQVERAVALYLTRLAASDEFGSLVPESAAADARWHLQLLLTEMTGGPMAYDGPDLASVRDAAGIDATRATGLAECLVAAFAASHTPEPLCAELREVLGELARALGLATPRVVPERAEEHPVRALVRIAHEVVAAAGLSEWPLFVLDGDLVVVHQNPLASEALAAAESDLRRGFGLGPADLVGHSVLRFHPAPTQLQRMLHDPRQLPREVTWSFGRTTWRVQCFQLPGGSGGPSGFAMAWRDESAAHRRESILARLRAQAEELPVPVMFPDATGELWYGNAACEHALARLAAWLPAGFNPSNGIPGAIFFPDAAERQALFSSREALPLKTRLRFGPETVSLLVSAVCDDDQQMLCPQVTWEIVHSIAPPAAPVRATPAHPVSGALRSLPDLGEAIRREARALEAEALTLQRLSELFSALADQAVAGPSGASGPTLAGLGEESDAAARLAAQGLAALAAAREVAVADGRSGAVDAALERLMAVARHTNQLVVDASLSAIEQSVGEDVDDLLASAAALRAGLEPASETLTARTQEIAHQVAAAVSNAGRLTELREALRDSVAPAVVPAGEAVPV